MFDSQSGEDKVRKFVLFLTLTTGMSGTAMAEGWEFSNPERPDCITALRRTETGITFVILRTGRFSRRRKI